MIRALLLMIGVLVAAPALAQDRVRVLSGEHAGFSRLVLTPSRAIGWQLEPETGGYRLRLDRPAEFDADGVFDRIPRQRLIGLQQDPDGSLHLRTPPGTPAESFLADDRRSIVIDLSDATGVTEASETAAAPRTSTTGRYRPELPPLPDVGVFWRGLVPSPRGPVPAAGATAAEPAPAAVPDARAGDAPPMASIAERAMGVERDLLDQLARAAAQGLIAVDPNQLAGPPSNEPPPGLDALPEALPDRGAPEAERSAPVEAETSVDRALGTLVSRKISPAARVCLPDSTFDVAAWSDDRPFAEQLGALRAKVVSDADRPDPGAVLDLARFYVAQGFGAEALELMRAFPPAAPRETERAAVLRQMARLVDGLPAGPGPLDEQTGCDGSGAAWIALAAAGDPRDAAPRAAVLRGIAAMPLALRRQFGPLLAERFLAIGDTDAVQVIRDSIARAPGDPGQAAEMLAARIDLGDGNAAAAARRLAPIGRTDTPMAPEAQLQMLTARLDAGQPIDPRDILLAQSQAFTNRGSDLGLSLRRVAMRALAVQDRIEELFAEHDQALAELPEARRPEADRALVAAVAVTASEVPFLEAAFRAMPEVEALGPGDPLRETVAARIESAGFTDRAEMLRAAQPAAGMSALGTGTEGEAGVANAPAGPYDAVAPQIEEPPEAGIGPTEAAPVPPPAPTLAASRETLAASQATRDAILEALRRTGATEGGEGAP
ncbi:hypothetical protein [Frigidibacter sp. MR17.24]|uniref:hypothetical protein n=1 Tax=Frigidibacter sp. MR17.24 TaxID=3127345 RepID=UPI003012AEC8